MKRICMYFCEQIDRRMKQMKRLQIENKKAVTRKGNCSTFRERQTGLEPATLSLGS